MQERSLNTPLAQKPLEYRPVRRAFGETSKRGTSSPVLNLRQAFFKGTCGAEDLWMGHDSGELVNALPDRSPRTPARGQPVQRIDGA